MGNNSTSRRRFPTGSLAGGIAFPVNVPSRVLGCAAPSNLIQVAQIGRGRIASASEMPGILRNHEMARFVAIRHSDTVRMADARTTIERDYARRFGSGNYAGLKTYTNYREMLQDKSMDAVLISTPDHWHAQPAIEAALTGKDIFLQKPASLTLREGRRMADVVKRTGRIFQLDSQQRSGVNFRLARELVRNGRIGKVREVYVGLPTDPSGGNPEEMPVPSNLNYTEDCVHPQTADERTRYNRPGWLRCKQFGAGTITGWGSHHVDTAHWGMGAELAGPVELEATAVFPEEGLWDVHGPYHVRARYADGAMMYISGKYPNGIKFLGERGWIWVTRCDFSAALQAFSAGGSVPDGGPWSLAIDASDRRWIKEGIKDSEIHPHVSPKSDHRLDWLVAVKARKNPAAPAEVGHRSNAVRLLGQIAMHAGRVLTWDPDKEVFAGKSADFNSKRSRPQRTLWLVRGSCQGRAHDLSRKRWVSQEVS
jgi:predicted dehydrogenase